MMLVLIPRLFYFVMLFVVRADGGYVVTASWNSDIPAPITFFERTLTFRIESP